MIYKYLGTSPIRVNGKIIRHGDKVEGKNMDFRKFRPDGIYSGVDAGIKKAVKPVKEIKIKKKRGKRT